MAGFDDGIKVYFGGDTTRLQQSIMAAHQMTKKFAQESADVFEKEITLAEASLASVRKQNLIDQGGMQAKLADVQREALGLHQQIMALEEGSLQRVQLQIQYEKKKSEILAINRSLSAGTAAEQRGVTTAMTEGVKAQSSLKEGFKAMGVTIKGLGLGILINAFRQLGTEAVRDAQAAREELEKLGKPIDSATRSLAALGDGIANVKKGAVEAVGFLVGGFTQLGDVIGSTINRMRGISEAQENVWKAGARAADEAEARRDKSRQDNSPEKIEAAEKKLADARRQNAFNEASDQRKIQLLRMEQYDLEKEIDSLGAGTVERREKLVELEKKRGEIAQLQKKFAADVRAEVDATTAAADAAAAAKLKAIKEEKQALEEQNRLNAEIVRQKNLAASAAIKQAEAEREINRVVSDTIDKLEAQAMRGVAASAQQRTFNINGRTFAPARDQRTFDEASDAELQELIRRRQQDLKFVEDAKGTGPSALADAATGFLIHGIVQSQLQTEINRAKYVLDQRGDLGRKLEHGGIEGARRAFAGDPLQFDRLVQELTKGRSIDDKILEETRRTNALLSGKFVNQ